MQALSNMLMFNKTIEDLRCATNDLGPEGAAFLAPVLRRNYRLKHVDLHANQIGPHAASLLVDSLKGDSLKEGNRTVETLNLSWNGFGSGVAHDVAEVLKENEVLTDVDLSGNSITSDGAISLARSLSYNLSLHKLNLAGNKIDKYGAFALAEALGRPGCPLQPEDLNWKNNSAISDEGVTSLSRVSQLKRNRQHWLGTFLKDLCNGSIHSISWMDRQVGDEEVLLLAKAVEECKEKSSSMPLIRSMWLSGSSFTSRSLVPLFDVIISSPANVMRVYLKDCSNMGFESIETISLCLPRAKTLEVLCLSGCGITETGAAELAKGLARNTSLRRLNLDHNRIKDKGLLELASVLPHRSLTALSANNNGITDASLGAVGLTQVNELHLKNNMISNKGALALAQNLDNGSSRITWLSLQGNNVTTKGGETIRMFMPDAIPGAAIIDY
jgi:Ran GTPase-activating protein (RanGAP) involved in mRNA processing and transport